MKVIKRYELTYEESVEISKEQENKMLEWLKDNISLDEGDNYSNSQLEEAYQAVVGEVEAYAPENALTMTLNGRDTKAELIDYFVEG